MGVVEECSSILLIDEKGKFKVDRMKKFSKQAQMKNWGISYTVVSIMGPQSSGKSTLLNHLFLTNFKEMNASEGRHQTTKGIWTAKCPGIGYHTLVMDVEGTDGGERGQDGTAFEKKSTLFALYVSDILLINMWFHDIGREQAANKPLLRTVFEVAMRLFSDFISHKRTLVFVIRDTIKDTPQKKIESQLRNDIEKIWDSVPKPKVNKETSLSKIFNVDVVFLSSYAEKEREFKKQVASFKQRFSQPIESGGLAGDRRNLVPASAFSFDAEKIWGKIKNNRDLNLPAHKFMVATVQCEQIANEKFDRFTEEVRNLEQSGSISKKKFKSLGNKYLSEFDAETEHYDKDVRSAKRKYLEGKLLRETESPSPDNTRTDMAVSVGVSIASIALVAIAVVTHGLALPICLSIPGIYFVRSAVANFYQ